MEIIMLNFFMFCINLFLRIYNKVANLSLGSKINLLSVAKYWNKVNVTSHYKFTNINESLEFFHWRNDQYYPYINLMPVIGFDNKIILDYGCGPGHDLVGFGVFSKPTKLIGADLSAQSLAEAQNRLNLHKISCELIKIDSSSTCLPFDNNSIDHIHCSGVLHHTTDPISVLKEFKRILKLDGSCNIMIYNYNSLFLHLYVGYQKTFVEKFCPELSLLERFSKCTDGPLCPISNCYKYEEWLSICEKAGLSGKFVGAAISMHEMRLLPLRFNAILDRRLPKETRDFLLSLTFDEKGYPLYKNTIAGIDGCFNLKNS
jgi:ubiquinone/menaquinone biosynthesis C-methylase UbiE